MADAPGLPSGTRLGPFEVQAAVGAGGMGEVYRAKDTRLGRSVAVKVLPSAVASDPDRRKRFEREARAVAALSHPNICVLYDVGREDTPSGPIDYLVMELLDGETLAERLRRGPMPTEALLKTGIEIASALDKAHRAGVVHRDVKPGNIVLTKTGAKLLDFGLARLRPASSDPSDGVSDEPTKDQPLTDEGKAVGTYPYMAPEQLLGKTIDARADLFALGALLYEMVTGRRAFPGTSQASVTAAILSSEPAPLTSLRPVAPKGLERLVKACLVKDPEERIQSAHDVLLQLQWIIEESGQVMRPLATPGPSWRRRAFWTAVALAGMLAAAAWLVPRFAAKPPPRMVQLTTTRGLEFSPTFSPDGEQIAFAWQGEKQDNWDIYIKAVDSPEVRRLTTDPAPEIQPRWSPDGRQIAYLRLAPGAPTLGGVPSTIHLVSPLGGSDRKVSDFPVVACDHCGGAEWSPDGRWLAVSRKNTGREHEPAGIYLVSVESGEARLLKPPTKTFDAQASFAPDGRHLAYASCDTTPFACGLEAVELGPGFIAAGAPHQLTKFNQCAWAHPAWTRDSRSVVYSNCVDDSLWRVEVSGSNPTPERVELSGAGAFEPSASASHNRLAFRRDRRDTDIYRFDVGHPPKPVVASSTFDGQPSLSPDGRRIAFSRENVWLAEADGSSASKLTLIPGGAPAWSPDGRRIAFDSWDDGRYHLWTIDVDGGPARQLTRGPGDQFCSSWSRDGRSVYFWSNRDGKESVWRIPASGGTEEQLTQDGGSLPMESLDGNTLFFMRQASGSDAQTSLFALPMGGGPERKVLDCVGRASSNAGVASFTIGPGGIYHWGCREKDTGRPLYVTDPTTGRSRLIEMLERAGGRPSVSADGRTILYVREVGDSDLMMIDNFR